MIRPFLSSAAHPSASLIQVLQAIRRGFGSHLRQRSALVKQRSREHGFPKEQALIQLRGNTEAEFHAGNHHPVP